MQLWSATLNGSPTLPPFENHRNMYKTIDKTPLGDIPWSSFTLKYNGARPSDNVPEWMNASFEVCYCDPRAVIHGILGHPGFKDDMDYVPYHEYDSKTERRHWRDFMSGDWAWMQAVRDFFQIYSFHSIPTGRNCQGPFDTWVHFCPCHPW
jgi:hypothetical protein